MSHQNQKPKLQLVSEFSDSQYPITATIRLQDDLRRAYPFPLGPEEQSFLDNGSSNHLLSRIKTALHIAQIKDYKLLSVPEGFQVLLKKDNDVRFLDVAMNRNDDFEVHEIVETSLKNLKHLRSLRKAFNTAIASQNLEKHCRTEIAPGEGVRIISRGRAPYINFWRFIESTADINSLNYQKPINNIS